MTNYLEAAAALVKKMSDNNEANRSSSSSLDAYRTDYVKLYALLAAIDKGILPAPMAEEIYGQLRSKTNR